MKKVLFNKFVKLFEIVCILIAAAVMFYSGIKIDNWIIKIDEYEEEISEEAYENETINEIYMQMGECIDKLVMEYKETGLEGVIQTFNSTPDFHQNYRIAVTTDREMLTSTGKRIEPNFDNGYNLEKVYREYPLWDNMRHIQMRVSSIILTGYCTTDEKDVIDRIYSLDQFLSDETINYLESIDYKFKIKIAADYDMVYEIINSKLQAVQKPSDLEENIVNELPVFIIGAVIVLVLTILLIISCGKNQEQNKVLNYWEKGYCEVHIAIAGGVLMALVLGAILFYEYHYDFSLKYIDVINAGFIAGMLIGIIMFYYEAGIIIKKIKNERFIKDWLIVRITHKVKKNLKSIYDKSKYAALKETKRLYVKKVISDINVLVIDVFVIVIMVIAFDNMQDSYNDLATVMGVFLVIFNIIYTILSIKEYKHISNYSKVAENINLIYNGKFNQVALEPHETNELLSQVASLSTGFKESVAKQVEAEKMQIELVANVSHDLKTPLTSIISYVDLLSHEELPPVAQDYVRILEDKSARLKDIVADVFDLAKATSGEQVTMEKLDGVVLVNQVLSDMSDKLEASGRELRVKISADAAPVTGNGQKLYRVFQNIIDNALKYSMPGTRIYLSAEIINNEFVVILKNISEYEMNFTKEEILSRFTRGDKSRHSEGNGLGLAIAKSFTELCGGTFDIELDDDVFKVIIILR